MSFVFRFGNVSLAQPCLFPYLFGRLLRSFSSFWSFSLEAVAHGGYVHAACRLPIWSVIVVSILHHPAPFILTSLFAAGVSLSPYSSFIRCCPGWVRHRHYPIFNPLWRFERLFIIIMFLSTFPHTGLKRWNVHMSPSAAYRGLVLQR